MIDEGTLRERYPEIPWDQPVLITINQEIPMRPASVLPTLALTETFSFYACRYCVAMKGLRAQDVIEDNETNVYLTREAALDHIEAVHHD